MSDVPPNIEHIAPIAPKQPNIHPTSAQHRPQIGPNRAQTRFDGDPKTRPNIDPQLSPTSVDTQTAQHRTESGTKSTWGALPRPTLSGIRGRSIGGRRGAARKVRSEGREEFRSGRGASRDRACTTPGNVVALPWRYTNTTLALYWYSTGSAPALRWYCTGAATKLH